MLLLRDSSFSSLTDGPRLLHLFKLHESRATVDVVKRWCRHYANELESITLPDRTTQALDPAVRDAFAVFEDICLLDNGESPQFLHLEYPHKTFCSRADRERSHELRRALVFTYPRPVCQLELSSNHSHVHGIPSSCSNQNTTSSPAPQKHSEPAFPLSLCDTRVVFHLLKQFSPEPETEGKVILSLRMNLGIAIYSALQEFYLGL